MGSAGICTCTKSFNSASQEVADAIIESVHAMRDHWPLTVRQVYYQLVSKELIRNNLSQYRKVSRTLVKLRELDLVPWDAIEDRSRRTTDKRGYSDVGVWLQEQLDYIHPQKYGRCYVQRQSVYVEVSSEKDALSSIIENAIFAYCTRLNIIRGQVSATHLEQMSQRFDAATMRGQRSVLLHCGDLDPTGVAIPKAIQRNLEARHGVEVEVRHIALRPEHIVRYGLPNSIDSVKQTDPNYQAWLSEFGPGQSAVELDALHPDALATILREELNATYDMGDFGKQMQAEMADRVLVGNIRKDILNLLRQKYPALMA